MAKNIMIICGEASGDLLSSELIGSLLQQDSSIEFSGIFGASSETFGLKSLYPLAPISVMGFTEIFSSLFHIHKALQSVYKHLDKNAHHIDAVICVDAFAFTHRVAKYIHKKHPHIKIIKYVPPKLWAWGPWRVKKLAIYDLILATLPFEKKFFESYNIQTEFIGHSVLDRVPSLSAETKNSFHLRYPNILKSENDNGDFLPKKILLLPGSRKNEIKSLLPIFCALAEYYPQHHFILPVAQGRMELIQNILDNLQPKINLSIIESTADHFNAFHISDCAVAASGTVSLELMMTNTPAIITYKVSGLTAFIARKLVTLKYVTLLNIILDNLILPEYLQSDCNINALKKGLDNLLTKGPDYKAQLEAFKLGKKKLYADGPPAKIAAIKILSLLEYPTKADPHNDKK